MPNQKNDAYKPDQTEILHTKLEIEAENATKHRVYKNTNHVEHPNHSYITKKIKAERYKQTIEQTQTELPRIDRVFSKIIHQSIIENLSELFAKTIARPNSILVGAATSLFVGIYIIYTSNNIGFEIPASIFITLYLMGYAFGLIIDMIIYIAKKLNHKLTQN